MKAFKFKDPEDETTMTYDIEYLSALETTTTPAPTEPTE